MESDGSICIDYSKYEHWNYEKFARFVNNMLLRRDTQWRAQNLEGAKFEYGRSSL